MRKAALALLFLAVRLYGQGPHIDAISPSRGPISGGTTVTINGANLGDASASFDRTQLTPVSQSAAQVVVTMPPHDNGFVVLTLRNASGAAHVEYLDRKSTCL